jgi:GNAT superfamily N-acetyltransferase
LLATRIQVLSLLPAELRLLVQQSEAEGFRFLQRLRIDWITGTNRFDGRGEALFGAYHADLLVGVCGLNVDPYLGLPQVGRVRHLYVAAAHRRCGVGRALLRSVVLHAESFFQRLRLRTDSPDAACFYESQGFARADHVDATHFVDLRRRF